MLKTKTSYIQILAGVMIILAFGKQSAQASDGGAAAQANNPLANLVAFNVQSYFIGDLTGMDETVNQFWFRYAQPFSIGDSSWLFRASLPINSFPQPPNGNKITVLEISAHSPHIS